MNETRYIHRRYYAPCYGAGACGRQVKPDPGTTFSEVRASFLPPATDWLEQEDRDASRRDMEEIEKTAKAMPKQLLIELLQERGVPVRTGANKRELVLSATLLEMRRRWPIMVVP